LEKSSLTCWTKRKKKDFVLFEGVRRYRLVSEGRVKATKARKLKINQSGARSLAEYSVLVFFEDRETGCREMS
jgi:hypothetical protein